MIGATAISAIISGAIGWFRDKAEAKQRRAERKDRIEEAKTQAAIKRVENGDHHAADLDLISLKTRGIKDDVIVFLWITPIVMSFVPSAVDDMRAGFTVLASLPEYWWYGGALIFIDTFGFRRLLRSLMVRGPIWK
ncbi:hypothetical protein [Salinivibrio sp. IB872]|uniref:hypothetical protein n=1 Tax=Salinivibrio sp. IB872 TaxID=1766123 RepID=UPI0009877269|nr:hypothetical protein [Salinivibrio sp. IB872]OOF25718.1 hypothetical protein BZJ18_10935 [Salinivibrio sp. IB872]